MDIEAIKRVLPHRYPFLLVDRVLSLQPGPDASDIAGLQIEAIKCVTINEPFFQGHFPHRPVMPGVLVVEAMAQVGALAVDNVLDEENDFSLVGINSCKFRAPVVPGDRLLIKILGLKKRQSIACFKGEVFVEDKLVAQAELMAKVFPREKG